MRPVRRFLTAMLAFALAFSAVPASAGSYLNSIQFADSTHGFLGGSFGTTTPGTGFMSVTDDGGATWHAFLTGSGSPISVAAKSASTAAAVDEYKDQLLWTTNSGESWAIKSPLINVPPVPLDEPGLPTFSDIATSSVGYVAVGKRTQTTNNGDAGTIYTSTDGVSGWTQRFIGPINPGSTDPITGDFTPGAPLYAQMDQVAFAPGGQVGWAIGSVWTDLNHTSTTWSMLLYKTTDGGLNWTKVTASSAYKFGRNDMVVVDTTHAYIVGPNRTLFKTTNGTTWADVDITRVLPLGPSLDWGLGIDAIGNTVVAVGFSSTGRAAVWKSFDGGATWPTPYIESTVAQKLRSVQMISATKWIVVGDNETIGRTNDAGVTWTFTQATAPTVGITTPAQAAALSGTAPVLSGTAADVGAGVAAVDVAVKRDSDGAYWNALSSAWVASGVPVYNRASTLNGWDNWTWTWALGAGSQFGQTFTVTARSTDAIGQNSTIATRGLVTVATTPDVTAPNVAITAPASGATLMGQQTAITGTATDGTGSGVASVDVKIQRSSDNWFWNGSAWGSAQVWNAASSTNSFASWSYGWVFDPTMQGGSVRYTITARATDKAAAPNSATTSVGDISFAYDAVPPTVALTGPAPASTVAVPAGQRVMVTGMSADVGSGVNAVDVAVVRQSDGRYWNGSAWVTGPLPVWNRATTLDGWAHYTWAWLLDAGQFDQAYTILARATDHTGNVSGLAQSSGVRVTNVPVVDVTAASTAEGRPRARVGIRRGATVPIDLIRFTASNGNAAVSELTVTGRDSARRLQADVAEVMLYRDNGDGVFGIGDTKLASGRFPAAGTSVGSVRLAFPGTPLTIASGSTQRAWVVYRLNRTATPGDVLGSAVAIHRIGLIPSAHLSATSMTRTIMSANNGRTITVRR